MNYPINDPYFRVDVLSKSERPNLLSYLAMHQCYTEKVLIDEVPKISQISDEELGDRVVNHCLKFGHFSVIEHPHITFAVSGFPHNVMAQATRHRTLSFSVQSQRYTCDRIVSLVKEIEEEAGLEDVVSSLIEKVFYLRPIGEYLDRQGNKYLYREHSRLADVESIWKSIRNYARRIEAGFAPEHSRDLLPQNIRQDFVVTFNARSLLHFCDLRIPKDAQSEIRTMAEMLFEEFKIWMPSVAEWYEKNRKGKNKLSP
jgi:thymidylate synthase (FAD)